MKILNFIFNWVLPIYVVYLIYIYGIQPLSTDTQIDVVASLEITSEQQKIVNLENNLFHSSLLNISDIDLYMFNNRNIICNLINDSIELNINSGEDVYYVDTSTGWWFSKYFKTTYNNKTSDYLYIGKVKDDKPNGNGVLLYNKVGEWFISYAGGFKDGQKDGYGIEFAIDSKFYSYGISESSIISIADTIKIKDIMYIDSNDMTTEEMNEYCLYYSSNYPLYEGEFSDNKMEGKGNFFFIKPLLDLTDIDDYDYDYDTYGNFEYNKLNSYFGIFVGKIKTDDDIIEENTQYIGRDKTFRDTMTELDLATMFEY